MTTHPIDTEAPRSAGYWQECAEGLMGTVAKLQDAEEVLRARLVAAEHRATRAESERDEWRQAALEERTGLLDALDQLKVRDTRIRAAVAILDEDTRWQNEEHLLAKVRAALGGEA